MLRRFALLALLSAPSAAAAEPARVVAASGTALTPGTTLTLPAKIDARGGSVTLAWDALGAELTIAGLEVQLLQIDERAERARSGGERTRTGERAIERDAIRVRIGAAARATIGRGQRLALRADAPGVFAETPKESQGNVVVSLCQTSVRIPAGGAASFVAIATEPSVTIQAERGTLELALRRGERRVLLAPATATDVCVPLPARSEAPETRLPLTPFEP